MASCFIIFKDGRCFSRRWTGYDLIIEIAIKELYMIEGGEPLAKWLELQIPDRDDNSNADEDDAGWGFYKKSVDDWINRELDLRSLTIKNQQLFWEAIQCGRKKLISEGKRYSNLNIDYFERFYKMFELSEDGAPPIEFSDWVEIADPCDEQNGPGWE